jgi:hypothetical protein
MKNFQYYQYYQTVEKLEAFSERANLAKQVGTVPNKSQIPISNQPISLKTHPTSLEK